MKKTIRSDVLYALCHILDDYPKFATALDQIQKNNRNNNWIHRILLMQKKGTVTLRANPMERNFYKENQEVIESIYNDGALTNFLWSEKTERDYFYQYLMKNRENLKQIIAVITKLRELKFYKINLDENADFTKSVFALSYDASHLAPLIHFCDNMYALPNFDIANIKYKTKKSDYLISIQYFGTGSGENPWGKEIILNNLVFDANRLPQNLNRGSIRGTIINLDKIIQEEKKNLQDYLNIAKYIDNLEQILGKIRVINTTQKESSKKDEIKNSLLKISDELANLHTLNEQFKEKFTETLNESQFEIEKKEAYKRTLTL